MKITLTNKTQYRDDDLRAIVRGACRAAGVGAKEVILTVTTGKRGGVGGRATCFPGARTRLIRGNMRLIIPTPESYQWSHSRQHPVTPLHLEVARVALHEAMHLAGVDHKDMTPEQFACVMPVPWAYEMQLRNKDVPVAAPREERVAAARADRLEHAQAMLAKATTRTKRAITIEKKWKRRVALLSK